jgi:thiosulfate reductase cytochrome b subunit
MDESYRILFLMKIKPKHPRLIRYTHWINGPVLLIMVWSGLLIYWAQDPYVLRLFGKEIFSFFPEWFYKHLDLEFGLATGMAYHFFFMWFFLINGLIYFSYTVISGEWRQLCPNRHTPREALHVVLHDLKLTKKPLPDAKFNGAQRLAYTGVVFMGAGSVLTGLAIWKPIQLSWLTWLLGGYEWARAEHFILMIGYVVFFIIHISQVIRAGWNNFRAMVTGYETVPDTEVKTS